MFTPKGFLVSFLHFWISLRRSAGVGKMRAVMMPSPPALETALASSAYPTYWKRSPESVFHRDSMLKPSAATACHLGDMSRAIGTLKAGRTWDRTHTIIPPCTTGTVILVS